MCLSRCVLCSKRPLQPLHARSGCTNAQHAQRARHAQHAQCAKHAQRDDHQQHAMRWRSARLTSASASLAHSSSLIAEVAAPASDSHSLLNATCSDPRQHASSAGARMCTLCPACTVFRQESLHAAQHAQVHCMRQSMHSMHRFTACGTACGRACTACTARTCSAASLSAMYAPQAPCSSSSL